MTDTTQENRISLQDNSDREPSNINMTSEDKEQTQMEEQPQRQSENKSSWTSRPEESGNAAGDWIQDKLNPIGQYAGKGLETIGKPVGGIVDPIVGGTMRSGEAFGDTIGVGFGNKEGGPAKQKEAEGQRMKESVGGEEQTGENPLGLNRKAL